MSKQSTVTGHMEIESGNATSINGPRQLLRRNKPKSLAEDDCSRVETDIFERFAKAYSVSRKRSRQGRRCLLKTPGAKAAGISLALVFSTSIPAHAATITVGLGCNLNQAIEAANTDSSAGSCTNGNGADTIVLSGGSYSAIANIDSDITIEANGATVDRLRIASGNATVEDAIVNGSGSTGITVSPGAGDVIVKNTLITGNSNGVRARGGNLTILESTINNNTSSGVSITTDSDSVILSVESSTISGNGGAGLKLDTAFFSTRVTIANTTISGNQSHGVESNAEFTPAEVTLLNSTVSGNAGTGVINRSVTSSNSSTAILTLSNSTVTGNNFVGVLNTPYSQSNPLSAQVSIANSLISGNGTLVGFGAREVGSQSGSFNLNSNVFGHSALSTALAIDITPGINDILATSNGTDPTALSDILDTALSDNGGPTDTHALVAGSPAVDATSNGPATDQRGVTRPQRSDFDIGAFEMQSTCNGLAITVDLNKGDATTPDNDVVLGTPGNDDIRGKAGDDTICGMGGNDFIHGNSGNDWIDGGDGIDNLRGGQGNDTIYAGSGATVGHPSRVFGGTGNDYLLGGPDADDLRGGRDFDVIEGHGDDDQIKGNEGNDLLIGNGGNDIINGGHGNDELYGDDNTNVGPGDMDVCDGGNGGGDTADASCEIIINVP